jgi:hypothetical protein
MDVSLFDTLFGSRVRARLLRLFLLSPDTEFDATEAAKRIAIKRPEVVKELNRLVKMRFVSVKTRQRKKIYQVRVDFPFYQELKALVSKLNLSAKSEAFKRIKKVGDVKLVLISGVFINYQKSKADMVLVINTANKVKLRQVINQLESEVGKEIRYILMNSEELHYRLDMLDRFLMEFLEGPYESVVDKVPELKRFVAGL